MCGVQYANILSDVKPSALQFIESVENLVEGNLELRQGDGSIPVRLAPRVRAATHIPTRNHHVSCACSLTPTCSDEMCRSMLLLTRRWRPLLVDAHACRWRPLPPSANRTSSPARRRSSRRSSAEAASADRAARAVATAAPSPRRSSTSSSRSSPGCRAPPPPCLGARPHARPPSPPPPATSTSRWHPPALSLICKCSHRVLTSLARSGWTPHPHRNGTGTRPSSTRPRRASRTS